MMGHLGSILSRSMSALGQKRTSRRVQGMSALPPKADIAESDWHVRFVPKADIGITVVPSFASKGGRTWSASRR